MRILPEFNAIDALWIHFGNIMISVLMNKPRTKEGIMERKFQGIQNLLLRNGRIHRRILEGRIARLGIHSSQHILLMHLMHTGRMPSQTQIAAMLDVSPASVARTLKSLEAGGYIERFDACSDGRCNEIGITEKGREICSRSYEIFGEVDRLTYQGFTAEELEQLAALLGRMQQNLVQAEKAEKNNGCREEEMKEN